MHEDIQAEEEAERIYFQSEDSSLKEEESQKELKEVPTVYPTDKEWSNFEEYMCTLE